MPICLQPRLTPSRGFPPTGVSRLWHTACASEEGEVIVFGGCANNLLAHSKAVSGL